MNYALRFMSMCSLAAQQGRQTAGKKAIAGLPVSLRLFYTPCTDDHDGVLYLVNDDELPPEGTLWNNHDVIHGGLPYDCYYQWVSERAKSLPVLCRHS